MQDPPGISVQSLLQQTPLPPSTTQKPVWHSLGLAHVMPLPFFGLHFRSASQKCVDWQSSLLAQSTRHSLFSQTNDLHVSTSSPQCPLPSHW